MAGKRVKTTSVKKAAAKAKDKASSKVSKAAAKTAAKRAIPSESLEQLMHEKEEIQALLSSLEDAYTEAAILEDDYNDIKAKNEKKLDEISRKIDMLMKRQPAMGPVVTRPAPAMARAPKIPVYEEEAPPEEEELKTSKEKPKKEKAATAEAWGAEDLKKLEVDLAQKIKEMVEDIGAKVSEKDLLEMKNSFAKFEAEIDKMKAQVEAVKESRRVDDDKIQRVIEGLAEVRTMVYGREASSKEQEIKTEKALDVLGKLEPEKILMEVGRRDKEISNQSLRISKLDETTKEFGEMLKRIEMLLRNIGSLEHVINISNEASEKVMDMQNMQRSNQKMLEKIQGIYAELSKRMEEFMLYRAKQDRVDDLMNDVMKNMDDLTTRAAYFVTRDDLESLRASVQASIASAGPAASPEASGLQAQKEEIEMLMKSIEEEFKSRTISKEEYEKMRKANTAKLMELESKIRSGTAIPPQPRIAEKPKPDKTGKAKVEQKPKAPEPKQSKETKSRNEMLLRDLEDTYKRGLISREACEKTKKMILGKG